MTTLLAEQPLVVSLMLAALGFGLIFGWLKTGKKPAAIIGLVSLLLIPAAWVVAENIETDREQIESIIESTAAAIQANEHDVVLAVIGDEQAKQAARMELPKYTFEMAQVNKLRSIEINMQNVPPRAFADMSVKVDVSDKAGRIRNVRVLRRLELEFEKRGDRWLVVEYRHSPVVGGPDQFTTNTR